MDKQSLTSLNNNINNKPGLNVVKSILGIETDKNADDVTIPVQPDEQIRNGVRFKCKFIATCEIARPSSKVEIVAAMRRIRYENKIKESKKKRALMEISTSGIKVILRKRSSIVDRNPLELILHYYQTNKIYYVAHDTTDILIYSYIAKNDDNTFSCSVFKGLSKRKTIDTVRAIGQAFEICHKENLLKKQQKKSDKETNLDDEDEKPNMLENNDLNDNKLHTLNEFKQKQNFDTTKTTSNNPFEMDLLNNKLIQQIKETDALRIQLNLLKASLHVEITARTEAQVQLQNALAHNRELLILLEKTGRANQKHEIFNSFNEENTINNDLNNLEMTNPNINEILSEKILNNNENTTNSNDILGTMICSNNNGNNIEKTNENWVKFYDVV